MRTLSAVGLMSGTSADGISLAWVEVEREVCLRGFATYLYRAEDHRRILSLSEGRASEIAEANMWLGHLFARALRRFLRRVRRRPDVIGSHGQTIFHDSGRSTLQIGEPSVIAEETGVTTVADFRPRDIAAGGEGAPLVPYFDEAVFGSLHTRALQNIGGIANVTVVGKKVRTLAFDTGPGNALIDEAVRMITDGRESMDRGGRLAASGAPDRETLGRLLAHPFLRQRPPKSTGREEFSARFLMETAGGLLRLRPADALATLTYFTARTIADAYRRFLPPVEEVVVSGGGAHNRTLMKYLEWLLFPAPVRSIRMYGYDPLSKEPAAFALMAVRAVQGRPNALGHASVLGKIVPGRNHRRLMAKIGGEG